MTTIRIPAPCDFINSNKRYHHMAKANLVKQWRLKRLINPGVAGFSGRIRAAPASAGNTRQGLTPSLVLAERGCYGFYIHHA